MRIEREVAHPSHVQFGHRLQDIPLGADLGTEDELIEEFLSYANILLGRADAQLDSPYLDLMEHAAAYYARAKEVEMLIFGEEHARRVVRGHPLNKFRTGQLRSFIEMSKMLADVGSRRLTQERLLEDQRYDAG